MVSVSLNTAVVSPKADPVKVEVESLSVRNGEFVKTPVSILEFQDFIQTTSPPKDELVISETSPTQFNEVIVNKTRKEKREEKTVQESVVDFSSEVSASIPNPAAVAPAQLDLVSEPDPVSNQVPKVAGSDDQNQSPQQHTAQQNPSRKDSLELSDQAKKEVQNQPAVERPEPAKPSGEDLKVEDHFNGLF